MAALKHATDLRFQLVGFKMQCMFARFTAPQTYGMSCMEGYGPDGGSIA